MADLTTVFKNISSRLRALESRPRAAMSYANIAVNGGLEVWTAGVGPFTANGASCADTWKLVVTSPATLSVLRDTVNMDTFYSAVCARLSAVSTGTVVGIKHTISGPFIGSPNSKVSLSARIRTTVGGSVRLRIGSLIFSGYHSGSGNYETLIAIGVPPSDPFDIAIDITKSCVVYVDNIMLVQGDSPIDYVGLTLKDNARRITDY